MPRTRRARCLAPWPCPKSSHTILNSLASKIETTQSPIQQVFECTAIPLSFKPPIPSCDGAEHEHPVMAADAHVATKHDSNVRSSSVGPHNWPDNLRKELDCTASAARWPCYTTRDTCVVGRGAISGPLQRPKPRASHASSKPNLQRISRRHQYTRPPLHLVGTPYPVCVLIT